MSGDEAPALCRVELPMSSFGRRAIAKCRLHAFARNLAFCRLRMPWQHAVFEADLHRSASPGVAPCADCRLVVVRRATVVLRILMPRTPDASRQLGGCRSVGLWGQTQKQWECVCRPRLPHGACRWPGIVACGACRVFFRRRQPITSTSARAGAICEAPKDDWAATLLNPLQSVDVCLHSECVCAPRGASQLRAVPRFSGLGVVHGCRSRLERAAPPGVQSHWLPE